MTPTDPKTTQNHLFLTPKTTPDRNRGLLYLGHDDDPGYRRDLAGLVSRIIDFRVRVRWQTNAMTLLVEQRLLQVRLGGTTISSSSIRPCRYFPNVNLLS